MIGLSFSILVLKSRAFSVDNDLIVLPRFLSLDLLATLMNDERLFALLVLIS